MDGSGASKLSRAGQAAAAHAEPREADEPQPGPRPVHAQQETKEQGNYATDDRQETVRRIRSKSAYDLHDAAS
jgi:hypothetical protein